MFNKVSNEWFVVLAAFISVGIELLFAKLSKLSMAAIIVPYVFPVCAMTLIGAGSSVNGNDDPERDTKAPRPTAVDTVNERQDRGKDESDSRKPLAPIQRLEQKVDAVEEQEVPEQGNREGNRSHHPEDSDRSRKLSRRMRVAIGAIAGDLITVIVFLLLLTFAWEFLKAKVLGSPRISFASTELRYDVRVQTVQHLTVPAPAAQIRPVSLVVLFPNGKSTLRPDQLEDISTFAIAAKYCHANQISVVGFASSRPFRSQSDDNNRNLANARASSVVNALQQSYADGNFQPTIWKTFQQMHAEARIRDTEGSAEKKLALEGLNRRVVLQLDFPDACLENRN